ncbi:MAG: hypothetical protein IPH07_19280 [Deltaproteobacteria bacterium]|nr:hypothetical protein [Deltaproteobacteria bacterium]MBK8715847.1 hypothetical protein [Deltaproteobacteria bacterium]MBP7286577.1 hypothetical protein [Nannocystaceae bacterium]
MQVHTWSVSVRRLPGAHALGGLVAAAIACGGTTASDPSGPASTTTAATNTGTATAGSGDASSGGVDSSGSGGELPPPSRWMVTADFLAGTLTRIDYDAVAAGAREPADIVRGTIDLSAYAPGPIEVEIAPDGHTALVAISPGFFDGIVGQTLGFTDLPLEGAALVVDLDTGEVVAELATAHVPLGFAFAPDGALAYSANYGHSGAPGSTLSVIDMATLAVVDDIEVGVGPEQVAIDHSGALGILNVVSSRSVRVFQTSDPAGTMSPPLEVSDDPSGVTFVPGTDLAVVANSLTPSNWAVIDVGDPAAPVVRDQGDAPGGFPYGVTQIPGTQHVLLTLANDATAFVRIDVGADPSTVVWTTAFAGLRSFPLGVAVDVDSGLAFSGAGGGDALLVIPLDGSAGTSVPWPSPGPTYVAIGPPRDG